MAAAALQAQGARKLRPTQKEAKGGSSLKRRLKQNQTNRHRIDKNNSAEASEKVIEPCGGRKPSVRGGNKGLKRRSSVREGNKETSMPLRTQVQNFCQRRRPKRSDAK